MHVQSGVPNWTDALSHMPDGGLVLSVSNGGTLMEAKRANPRLITAYRHHFDDQQFSDHYPTAVEIVRRNFRTFIDGTYLREYVPVVDYVLEYNEYYDQGMAQHDPDVLRARYVTAQAHANVWNDEYRGRRVTSADGGEGTIPASCKLVIGNSPVGNDIPRQFAELAISTDNVLGYHPYQRASVTQWPMTDGFVVRDPGDWRWHSGRWHFQEQAWGLKPVWCFTETMPYMGSSEGWRHPTVLNGNQALLVDIFRRWLVDVAQTPAYREGRILGPGAWFTVGIGSWDDYLLEAPQLIALADVARELWHPGTPGPAPAPIPVPIGDDMDEVTKTKIREHANAILALVEPLPWWMIPPLPFVAVVRTLPLTTYRLDRTVYDVRPNATYDLNVTERTVDGWLRVTSTLYVRAQDVKLKGT